MRNMTRRERWTRLFGLAAALAILGFCLSHAFEPTPGAWVMPEAGYSAVFAPGGAVYYGPDGVVTDPAERDRAAGEMGRFLSGSPR